MGQGCYTGIFFGAIIDESMLAGQGEDFQDELYEMVDEQAIVGAKGRMVYESENFWMGYWVVDCGQGAGWKIESIDREAFDIETLAATIRQRFPKIIKVAEKSWERLRKKVKKDFNLELPEGRLLLVNDYD